MGRTQPGLPPARIRDSRHSHPWFYDAQTVRVYDALSDPTCSSRRSCARALSRAGSTSRPGAGARAPAGWSGAPLDDRRRVVDPAAVLHALPHPRVRARQGIGEGGQVSPFESGFSGAALPCSCEAHLATSTCGRLTRRLKARLDHPNTFDEARSFRPTASVGLLPRALRSWFERSGEVDSCCVDSSPRGTGTTL